MLIRILQFGSERKLPSNMRYHSLWGAEGFHLIAFFVYGDACNSLSFKAFYDCWIFLTFLFSEDCMLRTWLSNGLQRIALLQIVVGNSSFRNCYYRTLTLCKKLYLHTIGGAILKFCSNLFAQYNQVLKMRLESNNFARHCQAVHQVRPGVYYTWTACDE